MTLQNSTSHDARPHGQHGIYGTREWSVRIEWQHEPGMTWPQFTYVEKLTKEDAEAEARRAITFGRRGADMWAVATFVRAHGTAEWEQVAHRHSDALAAAPASAEGRLTPEADGRNPS